MFWSSQINIAFKTAQWSKDDTGSFDVITIAKKKTNPKNKTKQNSKTQKFFAF